MGSATIRPEIGEDKYPIGKFILHRARSLGLSSSDLVRRLGYADNDAGHEALNAMLLNGAVVPQMANHLADALEAEDAVIGFIIGPTRRQ